MDAAVTVLFLGLLIAIGIIIGPLMGFVSPSAFGVVGPLFTQVTLAIILFEGGLFLSSMF